MGYIRPPNISNKPQLLYMTIHLPPYSLCDPAESRPLFFKMLFLLLALFIHFTIYRNATRFDSKHSNAFNKVAAWLSLISWFGVALAGRAVALTNPSGS